MCTENATKTTTNTPQNNVTNLPNLPKYLGYLKKNLIGCLKSVLPDKHIGRQKKVLKGNPEVL